MNRDDLISALSIEFILSKDEAEKIINAVLLVFGESLKDDKRLDIPRIGEFKVISSGKGKNKYVSFSPSKKLSKRVNIYFDELEKTELPYHELEIIKSEDEFSFKISDEFLKKKKEVEDDSNEMIIEKEEISTGGNMKKLISEELVKLHKEIIEPVNGNTEKRNNLWG